MEILDEIEIELRNAHYATWKPSGKDDQVIGFENDGIFGFVFNFDSVEDLLNEWNERQNGVLKSYKSQLKNAGDKAWNAYSVFVTKECAESNDKIRLIQIEENFQLTRKIARDDVLTRESIIAALLPLLPIQNRPHLQEHNYLEQLRFKLSEISENGATALLRGADALDIAQILKE